MNDNLGELWKDRLVGQYAPSTGVLSVEVERNAAMTDQGLPKLQDPSNREPDTEGRCPAYP